MGDYIYQQCSGVRCQQPKSTAGSESLMNALSFTGVGLQLQPHQRSGFRIRFLLTPETMNRFDLWQSRSSLTWPTGPGFRFSINLAQSSIET